MSISNLWRLGARRNMWVIVIEIIITQFMK